MRHCISTRANKVLLCLLFGIYGLLSNHLITAQSNVIQNEGFEQLATSASTSRPDGDSQIEFAAFWENDQEISPVEGAKVHSPEWAKSDGSHYNLLEDGTPVNAHLEDGYAGMARCELITQQFDPNNLEPNTDYFVMLRFRLLTGSSGSVGSYDWSEDAILRVFLSQNKPDYINDDATLFDDPTFCDRFTDLELQIGNIPVGLNQYPAEVWHQLTLQFNSTSQPQNFNWFTIELEETVFGDGQTCYVLIDDVNVSLDCCPHHMLYENTTDLPDLTHVEDFIRAGSDAGIPNTSGPVTVQSGQNVTFKAGNMIELVPGFTAEAGSEFTVEIEECNIFTNPTAGPITVINIPTLLNPCISNLWDIQVMGATSFSIDVFDQAAQLVHSATNVPINSVPFTVWNFVNEADAIYTAVITLTNCSNELELVIQVEILTAGCNKMSNPNDEYSKGGTNDSTESKEVVFIGDEHQQDIAIYPNPSKGLFTIEVLHDGYVRFSTTVRDIVGRIVYTSTSTGPVGQLDLGGQAKGIYWVNVTAGERNYTKRVVIQ